MEENKYIETNTIKILKVFDLILSYIITCSLLYIVEYIDLTQFNSNYYINLITSRYPNNNSEFNTEAKITLISEITAYLSIVILSIIFVLMNYRLITAKFNPANEPNDMLLRNLNCALDNIKEQSVVFLSLSVYWLFIKCNENERNNSYIIILLSIMFIVGRILNAIGYPLHSIYNIFIVRQQGFSLGFGVNSYLLLKILDFI